MAVGDLVHFDGLSDYLRRTAALSGATDGNQFTFSCCIHSELGQFSSGEVLQSEFGWGVRVYRDFDRRLRIELRSISGVVFLDAKSSTEFFGIDVPLHVFCSVDLADNGKRHLLVNGFDDAPTWSTYVDGAIGYTSAKWGVGANPNGNFKWAGCLGELWLDDQYLDPDTYLEKFFDGGPVDLGIDGSAPTGAAPLICLNKDTVNWHVNAGTGGDFSVEGGGLATCAKHFPLLLGAAGAGADAGPLIAREVLPLDPAGYQAVGHDLHIGTELLLQPASYDAQTGGLVARTVMPIEPGAYTAQAGPVIAWHATLLAPAVYGATGAALALPERLVLGPGAYSAAPGPVTFRDRLPMSAAAISAHPHLLGAYTYSQWLEMDGVQRVVLVDLVSEPTRYRLASLPYITRPSDDPPNVLYHARILEEVTVEDRLSAALWARYAPTGGELVFANPDGELDDLVFALQAGDEVTIRHGAPHWPIVMFDNEARTDGRLISVQGDVEALRVAFEGMGTELLQTLQNVYESTGAVVGDLRPYCVGWPKNVPGVIIDPDTTPEYRMHEGGPIEDPATARYINQAASSSPSITKDPAADHRQLEFNGLPAGLPTFDVKGAKDGSTWIQGGGHAMRHLLTREIANTIGLARGGTSNTIQLAENASDQDGEYVGNWIRLGRPNLNGIGSLLVDRQCTAYSGGTRTATVSGTWSPAPQHGDAYEIENRPQRVGRLHPDRLDTASFVAWDAVQTGRIGLYEDRRRSVADVLAEIVGPFGWYAWIDGLLTVGLVVDPAGEAADYELGAAEIDQDGITVEQRDPPAYRLRIGWDKNYTVASTASAGGSISSARATWVKSEYRPVVEDDYTILQAQPDAREVEINTLYTQRSAALAEKIRIWPLVKRQSYDWQVRGKLRPVRPGHVLSVTAPRYGLDDSHLFVTGRTRELVNGRMELECWSLEPEA
jgi:hypothetical protein